MNAFKKLSLVAALVVSVLAGCGGGTTTASGSSLGGTAAVGSPIVGGTIALVCAGGSAPATVTTGTVGDWSVTLTGQTLPCVVQVSGGTIDGVTNTTSYHSVANTAGTVNVTPITDLVVSNLAGSGTPATWFAGLNAAAVSPLTPTAVTAALTQVKTALGLTALTAINPLTVTFNPTSGNAMDDVLTALQGAITSNGTTLAALRTAASGSTFTPPVGFTTAINTAHGTTSSGGAAAPAAPTGLVATATSSSQITLTWSAVSGAVSYNVYAATATGVALTATNKKNSTLITALTYSGTGLTAATTYYIKVTALNAAGESVGSTEVTATTQAAASTTPTITSFSPTTGAVGTSVSITGTNFGGFTPAPFIKLSTTNAGGSYTRFTASSFTATNATFTVPTGLAAGTYSLTMANFDESNVVTAGTFTVTAAPVITVGSGVTFSAVSGGATGVTNVVPTVTTGSGLTFQTYTNTSSTLQVGYRLQLGVEEVNLAVTTTSRSALNNGGFSGAPGSCAIAANNFGAPLCSTFGITFDKTAGTVSFVNTPIGTGFSGAAPTVFTISGSLTFTPF